VLQRYQRRTVRPQALVGEVARELARRGAARLQQYRRWRCRCRGTLRSVRLLPIPYAAPPIPRVLGVDDFALRRRSRYATVLIDAQTGRRVDMLPDRNPDTLQAWLRQHPGVEVFCRDRSGAYAEAVRRALPDAIQVADRWHLWHGLGETARREVAAHSACWAKAGRLQDGPRAQSTRERWHQIHALLEQNVGLLECVRWLNVSLNTIKRYARASEPERLQRAPQYRPTLADPYREHLRRRRDENPAVGNLQLFREIKALGYAGSMNLLVRYITQGRVEGDRPPMSPRRLTSLMLTHPDHLTEAQHERRHELTTACPQMIDLTELIGSFATLLRPYEGNGARLDAWIAAVRAADLPHLHTFARGLELDREAVQAAVTMPYHNGGTEGVNTKTKRIMRQMHGRAGFTLLRHRILLN
jgi:transposase